MAETRKWRRFHRPTTTACPPHRHPSYSSCSMLLFISFFLFCMPTGHWAQQLQPLATQFFQPIIALKSSGQQQQQLSSLAPMFNNGGQTTRISRYDPTLKANSSDGYLLASAGHGTFVRTGPASNAPPLQILVEDRDLMPGMPSAVYHYILTGYGAERFAVDQHGNLYLNVDELDTDATGTPTFVLHVMAKEVDTTPQRSSTPISLTVHVFDDDDDNDEREQEQNVQQLTSGLTLPQTIYMANVSASGGAGERVIAQVKAREGESSNPVFYRIVEVSDGAVQSFRYDQASHELRANGPLYPGHRYRVVIEARDTQGLVGHAVVLVQALPDVPSQTLSAPRPSDLAPPPIAPITSADHHQPQQQIASAFIPPASPPAQSSLHVPDQMARIPSPAAGGFWQSNKNANNNAAQTSKPFWRVDPTTPAPSSSPNPMLIPFVTTPAVNAVPNHATEQNMLVELSEAAPIGSLVTTLGNEYSEGKVYFVLLEEGNAEGKFGMDDERTGTVTTKGTLDREQTAHYTLRIEARSRLPINYQLLYVTILRVDVLDVNDNAPQFVGNPPIVLSVQLDKSLLNSSQSLLSQMNLLLGRVEVSDPDQGTNGKVTLSVMPPLDRFFSINANGEVRVNGALSSAHLGEHQLTLRAVDHGEPPLESRTVVIVRVDGHFVSSVRETLLHGRPPPLGQPVAAAAAAATASTNFGHTSASSDESRPIVSNSASVPSSSSDYESGGGEPNAKLLPLSSTLLMPNGAPFTRVDPRLNGALMLAVSSTARSPLSLANLGANIATALNVGKNAKLVSTSSPIPPTSSSSSPAGISTSASPSSASSEELSTQRLAPVFDSAELKVFVEENEGQMELTRLHAHFPDGGPGPITYTLQSGDQSTFSVDPISGKVLLLRALDAESEPGQLPPVHRLKVGTAEQQKTDQFVTEPGLAHSCEMTIHVVDINDWIPNFAQEKYEFKIAESATSGTIVGQVVAFDQDLTAPNNKIRYELLEQQQTVAERRRQRNPFQIDTESGQIVVSDAEQLAHLAGQTVHLVAKAVDGGLEGTEQNGTAQVEIVVTEEMARSTMTTTMATTTKFMDEDDEALPPPAAASSLAPSMKSRTTGSASETTAPIRPVQPPPLPPAAAIAAAAAVQTAPQIQFVAHMFNATVAEGKRPPVLIQTLEVHNKPRDTRFTICAIREGNVKGAFSVTPNSRGDCEVRTQMQLDRESVANYRMNVSIQNGVQTDSAIVAVSVLDINDNKPKFVDATTASSSFAASTFDTSFAVLPLETEANAQFFSLTARDADTADSGNGAVTYALVDDQQMPSATVADGSDATFFGIDATTGKMFVRKKASEIAQLTRKDYFRVTASACDNPSDEATNKRLCSRVTVTISLLTEQHKFILLFAGVAAEQIRHNEKEIAKSLQHFTDPCPEAKILQIVDQQQNDEDGGHMLTSAVMYAEKRQEQKLCQTQEFQKLFTEPAKQQLVGQMREWGGELLDVFGGGVEDGRTARSGGGGGDGASTAEGIVALLLPIDWSVTSSTMLIIIALSVALVALVGLCALFAFRARHHQHMRRRAQQMRRRRGFSAGGGLLTVSNMKGAVDGGGLFSGIPSYGAGSNSNNNVYLPNMPLAAVSGGGGIPSHHCPFERGNKIYESQLLELPIGDDEYNNNNHNSARANPSFVVAPGAVNGTRCIGARNGGGGGGAAGLINGHDNFAGGCARGGGAAAGKKMFRSNASGGSPPHRQSQHSPPQISSNLQHGLRRKPNAAGTTTSVPTTTTTSDCFQRYYSPPQAATNHEGDFSVDESFYAANGQRCIY
uniref:Cadherin domain-containing protein n=1 Tax=Globodera rostochiensis TaxID=31243 RepID=A0A914I3I7_GLORO